MLTELRPDGSTVVRLPEPQLGDAPIRITNVSGEPLIVITADGEVHNVIPGGFLEIVAMLLCCECGLPDREDDPDGAYCECGSQGKQCGEQ